MRGRAWWSATWRPRARRGSRCGSTRTTGPASPACRTQRYDLLPPASLPFRISKPKQPSVTNTRTIQPYHTHLIRHVTYHSSSATPTPRATFLYTVETPHCNTLASLSGGAATTLIDFLTTLPLCHVADPAWAYLGVSRTLSLTFLKPAPAGKTVRIECEVLGVGRKLATVRATVKSEDGAVLIVAEHGLVSGVMAKA